MSQQNKRRFDEVSELLAVAHEQSAQLAEARAGAALLPSLERARAPRLSLFGARFAVGALTAAVVFASGVTWALVSRGGAGPLEMNAAALRAPSSDSADKLLRRAAAIGPAPARKIAAKVAPLAKRPVLELAVPSRRRRRAVRAVKTKPPAAAAVVATSAKPKAKGVVSFGDQPQGDVIIVRPKTKHGPLWTKESFEKVIRMRRGSAF